MDFGRSFEDFDGGDDLLDGLGLGFGSACVTLFKAKDCCCDQEQGQDELGDFIHGWLVGFSEGKGQGDTVEEAEFADVDEGFLGVEGPALGF